MKPCSISHFWYFILVPVGLKDELVLQKFELPTAFSFPLAGAVVFFIVKFILPKGPWLWNLFILVDIIAVITALLLKNLILLENFFRYIFLLWSQKLGKKVLGSRERGAQHLEFDFSDVRWADGHDLGREFFEDRLLMERPSKQDFFLWSEGIECVFHLLFCLFKLWLINESIKHILSRYSLNI